MLTTNAARKRRAAGKRQECGPVVSRDASRGCETSPGMTVDPKLAAFLICGVYSGDKAQHSATGRPLCYGRV